MGCEGLEPQTFKPFPLTHYADISVLDSSTSWTCAFNYLELTSCCCTLIKSGTPRCFFATQSQVHYSPQNLYFSRRLRVLPKYIFGLLPDFYLREWNFDIGSIEFLFDGCSKDSCYLPMFTRKDLYDNTYHH